MNAYRIHALFWFAVFGILSSAFLLMVGNPHLLQESPALKWVILTASNGGNGWAFIFLQWTSYAVGVLLWRKGRKRS